MTTHTQVTLLERLREAADPVAWDEFYGRYWRLIHATARRRGCSDHTAEEVVQEAMLAVFNHRDAFAYDPARGRFRDWLGTIVRNLVAKRRRAANDRIRPLADDAPFAAVVDPADGGPQGREGHPAPRRHGRPGRPRDRVALAA